MLQEQSRTTKRFTMFALLHGIDVKRNVMTCRGSKLERYNHARLICPNLAEGFARKRGLTYS